MRRTVFCSCTVCLTFYISLIRPVWNAKNAARIISTRRLVNKAVLPLTSFTYTLSLGYYLSNIVFVTEVPPLEYCLKLLFLPLLHWCFMLSVFLMFYHFFAATKYVLLKQSHLRGMMDRLLCKLASKKGREKAGFALLRREFLHLNRHLAYQCSEINGYNQFWSYILTVIFAGEVQVRLIFQRI